MIKILWKNRVLCYNRKKLNNKTNMKTKNLLKKGTAVVSTMAISLMASASAFAAFGTTPSDNIVGGSGSLRETILTIVNYFLGFLGLLAVLMVIYGGISYVTAGGEDDGAEKGKKIIRNAVIGIIIILLSFALINTVMGALGGAEPA